MTPPRIVVRSGKKTRFIAQDRDALFMTDLEALLTHPDDAIWVSTLVSRPLASHLFPSVDSPQEEIKAPNVVAIDRHKPARV